MTHPLNLSIIDINTKNLKDNLLTFRKSLPKGSKIIMAVKANAYGHGLKNIIPTAEKFVDGFQIDDICELIEIRKYTKQKIYIFGYIEPKTLSIIKKYYSENIVIGIVSLEHLREINKEAKKINLTVETHIAIDTGFGREGVLFSESKKLFNTLKNYSNVKVTGFYTHHTSSDELNSKNTLIQIKRFLEVISLAVKHGFSEADFHIEASGATLQLTASSAKNLPEIGFNYKTEEKLIKQIRENVRTFRIGLSCYGHYPSSDLKVLNKKHLQLKTVLTWKTKVAQIKHVPKGFSVGYGETFITKQSTRLALLPLGYSDGIPRSLSNNGYVLIRGLKRKIVGRVSMNMMVVDCGKEPNDIIKVGDEVVLIGKQKTQEITAEDFANWAKTIQYEVLVGIRSMD